MELIEESWGSSWFEFGGNDFFSEEVVVDEVFFVKFFVAFYFVFVLEWIALDLIIILIYNLIKKVLDLLKALVILLQKLINHIELFNRCWKLLTVKIPRLEELSHYINELLKRIRPTLNKLKQINKSLQEWSIWQYTYADSSN